MRKSKKIRMLAVASEGGHWVQLMRLQPLFNQFDTCYMSTNKALQSAYNLRSLLVVSDANLTNKLRLLKCFIQVLTRVLKERPTHVITTGAAPGFCALVAGKIVGAKTIWIDSIANAEQLSSAGRYAKYFADKWLTQWPELASENGPHYLGKVL